MRVGVNPMLCYLKFGMAATKSLPAYHGCLPSFTSTTPLTYIWIMLYKYFHKLISGNEYDFMHYNQSQHLFLLVQVSSESES